MMQQDIEILTQLKKKKPWTGSHKVKKEKFEWALQQLCSHYNLDTPKLIIPPYPKKFKWTNKYCGECYLNEKKIRIKNFTVITLLHEFKHWVDMHDPNKSFKPKKEKEKREYDACYYSARVFYKVWPERIRMLTSFARMLSNFTKDGAFKRKKMKSNLEKILERYQDSDIDARLHAETCAIMDIILEEFK